MMLLTHTNGIIKAGTRYGIPDGIEWTYDAIKKELDKATATPLTVVA
jgi:hypothetical protein